MVGSHSDRPRCKAATTDVGVERHDILGKSSSYWWGYPPGSCCGIRGVFGRAHDYWIDKRFIWRTRDPHRAAASLSVDSRPARRVLTFVYLSSIPGLPRESDGCTWSSLVHECGRNIELAKQGALRGSHPKGRSDVRDAGGRLVGAIVSWWWKSHQGGLGRTAWHALSAN